MQLRGLPDFRMGRMLVARALVLWLFLHAAAIAISRAMTLDAAGGAPGADGLRLTGRAALYVVSLTASLAYLDSARRNEVVFLQNLGVPRRAVLLLGAIPAAGAEALAFMLRGS